MYSNACGSHDSAWLAVEIPKYLLPHAKSRNSKVTHTPLRSHVCKGHRRERGIRSGVPLGRLRMGQLLSPHSLDRQNHGYQSASKQKTFFSTTVNVFTNCPL